MNCTIIQRRILEAEHPAEPPAEIRTHLDQCPACRAWQRRLIQVEREIPQMPVPPSDAKGELLQRILGSATGAGRRSRIADASVLWRSTVTPGPKERGLRKVSVAFALAASLVVFAMTWATWPREHTHVVNHTKDMEQARLDERLHTALRHGATAKERVLRLSALAGEIQGEARDMTDNAEQLEKWARFYRRIVRQELIPEARKLTAADRSLVLPTATERLRDAESAASRQAAQLKARSPRSADLFTDIALVSQNGEKDLRDLMKG